MSWLLTISSTHDSSVCLSKDNEIVYYCQEERLTHTKSDNEPFHALDRVKDYTDYVDKVAVSFIHNESMHCEYIFKYLRKIGVNCIKELAEPLNHHLSHAALGFVNSGFEDAVVVVVDGAGSEFYENPEVEDRNLIKEVETVFSMDKKNLVEISKSFIGNYNQVDPFEIVEKKIPKRLGAGMIYESMSSYLGFQGSQGCGKVMGLSSYGEKEFSDSLPRFLDYKTGGNSRLFHQHTLKKVGTTCINFNINNILPNTSDYQEDPGKQFWLASCYARRLQEEFEEYVYQLVSKSIETSGRKNVVLSGGAFLNCVSNFKLRKRLPEDINLFCEPVCGDDGISIGMQYILSNQKVKKLETLYIGNRLEYNYELLHGEYDKKITVKEVAKLLSEGNLVAIAQGNSEAGPRALGNRSILFNPGLEEGNSIVNKVKKREEWRPFAGTVLLENAHEWFEMDSLKESPFMTYAIDVIPEKIEQIKSIVHVNDTCRIQTLKKESNPNYYELISEFNNITGVPIIGNTSFNLAGDTIVDNMDDALNTLRNSDLEYLYLPEIEKLICVPNTHK